MALRSRYPVQDLDRSAILESIRTLGPISRADLARSLSLRPSSVTEIARQLIADGIITEVGQGSSDGGRPPTLLDINRVSNYAVSCTVEPRGITAALVRWDCAILSRASRAVTATGGPAELEAAILSTMEEALGSADVPSGRVRGISVGISALVDPAANEAVFSSTLTAARHFRLDRLEERFGRPVYMDDIAYLMALGERWFIYPNEERPLVFLLVASGTCGAVIEPWAPPGAPRFASEFGHMVVDASGPLCGCGKRGCLEAFVSEPAILATASRLLGNHREPPATIGEIADLARAGNAVAERIIETVAEHLQMAVANLANVFAPALIVLGGTVVDTWGDLLMSDIQDRLPHHLMEYLQPRVSVVASRVGPDVPLLGGAARVMQACFSSPREATTGLAPTERQVAPAAG